MAGNYPLFISYRREDSPGHAGRMYDRLRDRFGPEQVFWDIEVEPGMDFVEAIENAVGSCEVMVAVIGRSWLNAVDSQGRPRLHNPDDFVRLEIETALKRNVLVIPVLVFGAVMPQPSELPEGLLRKLARRNALEISDKRFDEDVERLMHRIEKVLSGAEARANLPDFLQTLNVRPESLPLSEVMGKPSPVVGEEETLPLKPPIPAEPLEGTDWPDGIYFSKDHSWIKVERNIGTIGITDYAQNALGDIVYLELPRLDEAFEANEPFGSVESVKAVSELFTPVSGKILEINKELGDWPDRVNADAYGQGWMIKLAVSSRADLGQLLSADEYEDFTKAEKE